MHISTTHPLLASHLLLVSKWWQVLEAWVSGHDALRAMGLTMLSELVCIDTILYSMWACVREAIIVRDCLEHIEPNCSFFALEMTRLKSDAIQGSYCPTGRCHFRAKAISELLTVCFATHTVSLLYVIALRLFDLRDKVVEELASLFALDFANLLPVLFRHSNLHLG